MAVRSGRRRRLYRTLRSPRFAAWLFVAALVWLVIGTTVPQTSLDAARVEAWAIEYPLVERVAGPLGLHSAFTHPLFLALMFLLAASTAVCAWDRTRFALRIMRAKGMVTPAQVARLRAAPPIDLSPAEESDPPAALGRASDRLRRMGLHSTAGASMLEASSGIWGVLASPLFHWVLVALIILIPVGRLTRSEGLMGVVVGASKIDERASYGNVTEGPFHRSFTGLQIGVEPDMVLNLKEGGVDRGAAPVVTLSRDGELVARQQIYPNRPLRHGSVTVHIVDIGVGVLHSLVTSDGVVVTEQALLDRTESNPPTYDPYTAVYETDSGSTAASLTIGVPPASTLATSGPPQERRRASIDAIGPTGESVSTLAAVGDTVDLGGGLGLRVDIIDYYARLSVVDDWSVTWIYALFVVGMVSVSISVLVPYRVVRVLLDTSSDTPVLRVETRHSRGSPEFDERVREALTPPGMEDR